MWPVFIVTSDPFIEIFLQIRDQDVELFAERHSIELVENRLVEALTDTIRLWALRLGSRMIDVFHGKIELIFVMLGIAAYSVPRSVSTRESLILFIEEWNPRLFLT